VDAKFPKEDYERLLDAAERADTAGMEAAAKALETRIVLEGRTLSEKYLEPPYTTDFAILFLPSEGLYSEVLRRPGLVGRLQSECRTLVAGPTTLWAILNSLQMGFRTLAIEKRSSEVWTVLGAVKTEFGRFGEVLSKVKRRLDLASDEIDRASTRSRVLSQKLREVEGLTASESRLVLREGDLFDALDAQEEEEEEAREERA
jgi:DNA recombination protein RmuC